MCFRNAFWVLLLVFCSQSLSSRALSEEKGNEFAFQGLPPTVALANISYSSYLNAYLGCDNEKTLLSANGVDWKPYVDGCCAVPVGELLVSTDIFNCSYPLAWASPDMLDRWTSIPVNDSALFSTCVQVEFVSTVTANTNGSLVVVSVGYRRKGLIGLTMGKLVMQGFPHGVLRWIGDGIAFGGGIVFSDKLEPSPAFVAYKMNDFWQGDGTIYTSVDGVQWEKAAVQPFPGSEYSSPILVSPYSSGLLFMLGQRFAAVAAPDLSNWTDVTNLPDSTSLTAIGYLQKENQLIGWACDRSDPPSPIITLCTAPGTAPSAWQATSLTELAPESVKSLICSAASESPVVCVTLGEHMLMYSSQPLQQWNRVSGFLQLGSAITRASFVHDPITKSEPSFVASAYREYESAHYFQPVITTADPDSNWTVLEGVTFPNGSQLPWVTVRNVIEVPEMGAFRYVAVADYAELLWRSSNLVEWEEWAGSPANHGSQDLFYSDGRLVVFNTRNTCTYEHNCAWVNISLDYGATWKGSSPFLPKGLAPEVICEGPDRWMGAIGFNYGLNMCVSDDLNALEWNCYGNENLTAVQAMAFAGSVGYIAFDQIYANGTWQKAATIFVSPNGYNWTKLGEFSMFLPSHTVVMKERQEVWLIGEDPRKGTVAVVWTDLTADKWWQTWQTVDVPDLGWVYFDGGFAVHENDDGSVVVVIGGHGGSVGALISRK